jgi:hypothetical protein
MSNHQAIAAVTATLRSLLDKRLGVKVTARPPDRVRLNNGTTQINLFLYQTAYNGALSNMPLPQLLKPGETGTPPLALNLYYLITAYGPDDENEDLTSHQLLGQAMSLMYDHPLLGAGEIQDATGFMLDSNLHQQVERIRITHLPMTVDELTKLWTTFQTNFRISAAYEVAVVLIESTRAAKTPLPVLARGKDDQGAKAQGGLMPPPVLEAIRMPGGQLSAKLGDEVILEGLNLSGSNLKVLISSVRAFIQPAPPPNEPALPPQPVERELQVVQSADDKITVKIPNEPTALPAGYYQLSVSLRKGEEVFDRRTNTLALPLAPQINKPTLPANVLRDNLGTATLQVEPLPQVFPEQRAALLLGELEVAAEPRKLKTDRLIFTLRHAHPGTFLVRLRVDGVDSLLIDFTKTPPFFDQTQTVTIT